jgi:hypothetical protein
VPGCVVAGRLAYADPNLKVMLIEGVTRYVLVLLWRSNLHQAVLTTEMILGSIGRLQMDRIVTGLMRLVH